MEEKFSPLHDQVLKTEKQNKEELDLRLDTERKLKNLHESFVLAGKPADYKLKVLDVLPIFGFTKNSQLTALLRRSHTVGSLNDVLAGIGLPHTPINEY